MAENTGQSLSSRGREEEGTQIQEKYVRQEWFPHSNEAWTLGRYLLLDLTIKELTKEGRVLKNNEVSPGSRRKEL